MYRVVRRHRVLLHSTLILELLMGLGCRVTTPRLASLHVLNVWTSQPASLEMYDRQPTILVVWATYCLPCRRELPALQRIHRDIQDRGINVVAISIDHNPTSVVRDFADHYGLTFPVYQGPEEEVAHAFHLSAIPETLFLDGRGGVKEVTGAMDWNGPKALAMIEQLARTRPDGPRS